MSKSFSYSITLSSFLRIPKTELQILESIVQIGFTKVEIAGEPLQIEINCLKDTLSTFNICVSGLTGMWGKSSTDGWKRRLLSRDNGILKHSESYVKNCIELCSRLGGRVFNICLFSDPFEYLDVTHNNIEENFKKKLLEKQIPLLKGISSYAYDLNVKLVLEPLNRYSTPYCCNYTDAQYILEKCDKMLLMLDTFHMNIEEDSFSDVILNSKDKLAHMHFAENNRKMPGMGHIDFLSIIRTLKEINYGEVISFEPTISEINYEQQIQSGFDFVRNLESTINL